MAHPRSLFDEVVNGIIVGAVTFPYEFWERDGSARIARGHFETDDEAIEWFRVTCPEAFKRGADMRVFEGG